MSQHTAQIIDDKATRMDGPQPIVGQINEIPSRQAMGLPNEFVATPADDLSAAAAVLWGQTQEQLAARAEDASASLTQRLAAGTVLGLLCDPRILTFEPKILQVPATCATLGLAYDKVDAVVAKYAHLGVIREWIEKECPQYSVQLPSFGIGKYCVTNAEYRDFLQDTGLDELPTSWEFGVFPTEKSNHPVYTVSAQAADAYCAWLSGKTGRQFRLPTEQEWECVASNGVQTEFPWGDTYQDGLANTAEAGLYRSTPVGVFPGGCNALGVCDLAGNVEEYTASDYAPYPYGHRIEDDLLIKEGRYRIARGGSFTRFSDLARSTRRHGRYNKDIYVMGFRLAESVARA
ncbi:MAG: SUMF1/EgtB/PvdO family nonheme iron enzyme [Paracoccaceae bacterium]